MKIPRFTTRRLMVIVAVVGALMGLAGNFDGFPVWLQGVIMAISLPVLTFLVFILSLLFSRERVPPSRSKSSPPPVG